MNNFKHVLAMGLSMVMLMAATPYETAAAVQPLDRVEDPVVLSGADIPLMFGVLPADLVAFRYIDGDWQQVPVQVDERKEVSYGADVYNGVHGVYIKESCDNFSNLVYCDPNTYVGADNNPYLDEDDEVVFMARDTGGQAPTDSWPEGVKQTRCVEITVTDPLAPGSRGYAYLFEREAGGGIISDAGKSYVSYEFKLQNGHSYKQDYPFVKANASPGNPPGRPEDSAIVTDSYTYHFSDRWLDDELHITAGDATGVDILDRNKVAVMPSSEIPFLASLAGYGDMGGSRTEDTFNGHKNDAAEGAFICNINGPVRAIRSYVGANSGPLTQRDYYAYDSRLDMVTYLRVHAMPSLMSFFDFSENAVGMTYYRNDATSGVPVDGTRDDLSTVASMGDTELLTGEQGSLSITTTIDHTLPEGQVSFRAYYLDDASSSPKDDQYTGDAYAYASSGVWLRGDIDNMLSAMVKGTALETAAESYGIPCTDPTRKSTAKSLTLQRTLRFRAPGMTFDEAMEATEATKNPLTYAVRDILAAGVQTWSVTYDGNGAETGSVPTEDRMFVENSILTMPGNPGGLSHTGYQFLGWADTSDATESLAYVRIGNGPLTLYAVWKRIASYSENGMEFVEGSPGEVFKEPFDYADGTTSNTIVGTGKWAAKTEATSEGAFSKVYGGKFVFQGRTSGSKSSGPRMEYNIDPNIVSNGSTLTLSCNIRTGTTGQTMLSLYELGTSSTRLQKMAILQNGTAKAGDADSKSVPYQPGTGKYSEPSGDSVPVIIVFDFGNKKYSAYANGQVMLENGTLKDWNTENALRLVLEGSYAKESEGTNWGEYDDIILRYAGVGVSVPVAMQGDVPVDRLPESGTATVVRTVRNERSTNFTALMLIGAYDTSGKLIRTQTVPVDVPARSMSQLLEEIETDGAAELRVFLWKDSQNMQPLLAKHQILR